MIYLHRVTKMKLAIIEDEQAHTDILNRYIGMWSKDRDIPVVITSFPSAESFLFAWEEDCDFDVLFVDIQMREMNGMEMARRIREQDSDIAIIFTTGIADYMEAGYEVEAMHYLLKPVSQEKLFTCMDRVLKKDGREQFLLVKTKDGTLKLSIKSIIYVEAMGHGCMIEFCPQAGRTFQVETTEGISELEEKFGESDFVRCHRSYLCRIDKIHHINRAWIEMDNGSRIPVSRRVYSNVNQMFIRYFREEKEKNG